MWSSDTAKKIRVKTNLINSANTRNREKKKGKLENKQRQKEKALYNLAFSLIW